MRHLLVTSLAIGALGAADTTGASHFHEGNSLMYPLVAGRPAKLTTMAADMGYPDDRVESVGAAGIPIDYMFTAGEKIVEVRETAQKGPFDYVILQPYGHNNTRPVHYEAAAGAWVFRQVREHSPDAKLMIYYTWTNKPDGISEEEHWNPTDPYWPKGTRQDIEEHLDLLTDILAQEFPDTEVTVIPAGQAFLKAHAKMAAGEFPGFSTWKQCMDNDGFSVHPTAVGYYLAGLCHLACIYQEDPTGRVANSYEFHLPWTDHKKEEAGLDDTQARLLQEIAWEVCTSAPRTAISGIPREKEDRTPPAGISGLSAGTPTARDVTVTWTPEYADDVTFLSVYVNDWYRGDVQKDEPALWQAANLKPGADNTITIRSWDAAYNFTDTDLVVSAPAQVDVVLAAWDLEDIRKQEPPQEADQVVEGLSVGPLTRSPAVGAFTKPWKSTYRLRIDGEACQSLAEALERDCYVSCTIDSGDQAYQLDQLMLAMDPSGTVQTALFSSATGFDSDAVIHETPVTGNRRSEIAYPLHSHPAGTLLGQTEFRLYYWGAQNLELGCKYEGLPGEPEVVLRGRPR